MTATQDDTIAELQRRVAELRDERDAALAELQARTATLAQRNSEYGERIKQQAATTDVLKAMSASPGDAQPVFQLIVERARAFCQADIASLALLDGDMLHLQAHAGVTGPLAQSYQARFPLPVNTGTMFGRAILACGVVQMPDVLVDQDHETQQKSVEAVARAFIAVPLLSTGMPIGAIAMGRRRPSEFSAIQIELLQTFAEQAVIAITIAETYHALQTRTSDLQESLNYQTATSDVLKVISRSTFDLQPVLDTVVETAARLCDAAMAVIARREGDLLRGAAYYGYSPEYWAWVESLGASHIDSNNTVGYRAVREGRVVHVHDVAAEPDYLPELIALGKQRTSLGVPLLRQGETIGMIVLSRQRVEPFTDRQIELISTFAAQAVIAIENTRLLTEQREALERQTATAEVLRTINENPGKLEPVFNVILEKALSLAEAASGTLWIYRGDTMHAAALRGMTPALAEFRARNPVLAVPPVAREASETRRAVQMLDIRQSESYRAGRHASRAIADLGGARTNLVVPLLKDNESVGCIQIYRQEVRVFTPQQISLLEGFAAQAVIAMDNARLLNEIRQRQNELDITFENMGDGVAMFDRDHRLAAWNRNFQDILNLPDEAVRVGLPFADYIRSLAARGEYGPDAKADEQIVRLTMAVGQANRFERTRPNGRVIDVRHNPIQGGGFVVIYADITERKRAEEALRVARDEAETALRELKVAQANLIQAEKMASLGQLTAGIAHEIKNPLNFVNNFAELSVDLLDELNEAVANNQRAEVEELTGTLKGNLGKIAEHGRRADGIVRGMLEHSRGSSGEQRSVDLNVLVDEALNLAYHGARAQDQSFNVMIERELGDGISPITLAPQDVTRVLLNLLSNGFYAVRERQRMETTVSFEPTMKISTCELGDAVEIRVRDNGIGIPTEIGDRLFQPFFTTKPTGAGTGLGLSISYEIITQQHGGSISVASKVGEYSEFTVRLPRSARTEQASPG